jgi:uncharacterized protein
VKQLLAVVWLALLALATPAYAQTFPPLTGRVVDQASILTTAEEGHLAALSSALERKTSDQLVVVTLETLGGANLKDFATRLGNHWGIGQKGLDNGVLLIVAPTAHQIRISVGYGLEGLLTDQRAGVVVQHMLPYLRSGRYAQGLDLGEREIVSVLLSDRRRPQRKHA